jgi:hypothetical protein
LQAANQHGFQDSLLGITAALIRHFLRHGLEAAIHFNPDLTVMQALVEKVSKDMHVCVCVSVCVVLSFLRSKEMF